MAIDFNTYDFEQLKKWRKAMSSLSPNGRYSVNKRAGLTWHTPEIPQPTDDEVEAEIVRLDAVYDSQAYARSRKLEYPHIRDQLDMIYHNGDGGATFQAAIKAVKDKYPK